MLRSVLRAGWRLLPVGLRSHALVSLAGWGLPKAGEPIDGQGPLYVAGFFRAPTGLGASARLYYKEAAAANQNPVAVDLTRQLLQTPLDGIFPHPLLAPDACAGLDGPGTVVVHVNPPLFLLALRVLRPLLPGKRIVGYWAWELMVIPGYWRRCLAYAHAIEVPSTFCAAAVRQGTTTPVAVHPHAVPPPEPATRRFAEDGVVRVLTIFDMASNFYRKNPLAGIRAFQQAFGHDPRARLYCKVSSQDRYPPGRDALAAAVAGWDTISMRPERLTDAALAELYRAHDILLSLHCSEGYGLTIRTGLLSGLHAVATGWSGNMDFMQGAKSHPVPYRLVRVADPQGGFAARGQCWAMPDVAAATAILRGIVSKERPDLLPPLPAGVRLPAPPLQADAVGVVLVNYRGEDDTLACLAHVAGLKTRPRRIVVVDNASGTSAVQTLFDGWSALCRRQGLPDPVPCRPGESCEAPFVLLALDRNGGFAAGNNAAMRLLAADSGCRAFWLLNNDTTPLPDALDALCARVNERPDAGMAGSLLVSQHQPDRVQCAGGGRFSRWTGLTRDVARGASVAAVRARLPEAVEQELSFLTAASVLLRREAVETVGPMPEAYFLYYEDVAYSLLLRRAGYALAFAPQSLVPHREGGSWGDKQARITALCVRNRLWVMRRFFPGRLPVALARQGLGLARALCRGRWRELRAMAAGCWEAFSLRPGD